MALVLVVSGDVKINSFILIHGHIGIESKEQCCTDVVLGLNLEA